MSQSKHTKGEYAEAGYCPKCRKEADYRDNEIYDNCRVYEMVCLSCGFEFEETWQDTFQSQSYYDEKADDKICLEAEPDKQIAEIECLKKAKKRILKQPRETGTWDDDPNNHYRAGWNDCLNMCQAILAEK